MGKLCKLMSGLALIAVTKYDMMRLIAAAHCHRGVAFGYTHHCDALEEVVELEHGADGPLEALAGVPQVAHDESVLPAALHRPRTTEVGGRGRSVVYSPKSGKSREGL